MGEAPGLADGESEVHGQERGHWGWPPRGRALSWGALGYTGVRQEEAGRERVRVDREWRLAEKEFPSHLAGSQTTLQLSGLK